MKRKCATCGEIKDISEFYYNARIGYWSSYCNKCRRLYNKEYKRIQRARIKDKENPIIEV